MGQETETVYLVDGTAYIHRAYHAIRNLSNSQGFPTNAVFGFSNMLLKLLADRKPLYLAVVFDSKGPTFRHKIYSEYKANRPSMPEDMAQQLPLIREVVSGLNLITLELPGYEADDVIGTLARMAEEKGFTVVMVTGDKDFRQLITPRVCMWDTMKDVVTDYAAFKNAYGIEPGQMIDVMGLSGDASDNVPGIPGVGEKTALKLIRTYGSLEAVMDHVDEIDGKKLQENLGKFQEMAFLSRRLVTIDRFVPLEVDAVENLRAGSPKKQALARVFHELEFKGLWEQFASRQDEETHYRLCLSLEDLASLVSEIKKSGLVSLDTETTSKNPMEAGLVGLSFSLEEGTAFYVPVGHLYPGVDTQVDLEACLGILREVLEDDEIKKVGQNIKYDAEVLKLHGVDLKGIHFDTMIASYVINPGLRQHNLDYLAQHYLNHKMIAYGDVVGNGRNVRNFSEVPLDQARDYSCEDADITLRLMHLLEQQLRQDENEELFNNLEMRLLPVLMDMELTGIKIDKVFFESMSTDFEEQLEVIEKEIYDEAGMEFNIQSPKQLGYVLFEKLKLPVQSKTTKTKSFSTNVKVLKKLTAFPQRTPELILRYRTLSKLKSTYLDALVRMIDTRTGRIHTSFNQTVAATGRLSSSNPNLQNIPVRGVEGREIRKGFVAEKGCMLLSADYSQVELRVLAHYSRDGAFTRAFERGDDVHTLTAADILGVDRDLVTPDMRRIAKAINFGIIYGMGPQKLSEEAGIPSRAAKEYIEAYYKKYQGVAQFKEQMIRMAREKGYVTTLLNRRRYLPDILHKNRVIQSESERMAINTPIQGTAADLIKLAMIRIAERLKKNDFASRMLLQVHDELVFEVPEGELERLTPMVRTEMEGVYPLRVPLKVDIGYGKNWGEAH
jgi:DNA polymerase-1